MGSNAGLSVGCFAENAEPASKRGVWAESDLGFDESLFHSRYLLVGFVVLSELRAVVQIRHLAVKVLDCQSNFFVIHSGSIHDPLGYFFSKIPSL